jgi:hypothetical protein
MGVHFLGWSFWDEKTGRKKEVEIGKLEVGISSLIR